MALLDLSGKRIGKVTVLERAPNRGRSVHWLCRCDCGTVKEMSRSSLMLKTKGPKSCGKCVWAERFTTHGLWNKFTRENKCFIAIHQRLKNPTHRNYKNYGGRGIGICERWNSLSKFPNFLEDMGPIPSPDYSIDRIDNDGDYSPENCRWATRKEQARNKRTTRWVTFRGERLCLKDAARKYGLHPASLAWRLDHGWDIEKALTTPSGKCRK